MSVIDFELTPKRMPATNLDPSADRPMRVALAMVAAFDATMDLAQSLYTHEAIEGLDLNDEEKAIVKKIFDAMQGFYMNSTGIEWDVIQKLIELRKS